MRGHVKRQPNLFVKINLEELVPAGQPLQAVKRMADEALLAMSRTFAARGQLIVGQQIVGQRVVEMGPSGACADGSPVSAQGSEKEREWSRGDSNPRAGTVRSSPLRVCSVL